MTSNPPLSPERAADLARKLIGLVPHWYSAEYGPHSHTLSVQAEEFKFHTHSPLSDSIEWLLSHVHETLDRNIDADLMKVPAFFDVVQEYYAMMWLFRMKKKIRWARLAHFCSRLSHRTSENSHISLNLVISNESSNHGRIDDPSMGRIVEQLGSSPYTFMRVTPEFEFIDMNEVRWSDIIEPQGHVFHPHFLHPIHSILKEGECSMHLTPRGDIVIMDSDGLLASKRKNEWKIYDQPAVQGALTYCFASQHVANRLFGIVFDLSYRRHGALLIYDEHHKVIDKIINPSDSIVSQGSLLSKITDGIVFSGNSDPVIHRRILSELASIDGAVVFDDERILAVGAVIQPHEKVKAGIGARTAAAKSAYHWGAQPVKISSDGEITFYFESVHGDWLFCDAELTML